MRTYQHTAFTLLDMYDIFYGGVKSVSGIGSGSQRLFLDWYAFRSSPSLWDVLPASFPVCTRGSFPEVERPLPEADHSPPTSAEVKGRLELYLTPPIRLHGVVVS
jgi:hypothetical protein